MSVENHSLARFAPARPILLLVINLSRFPPPVSASKFALTRVSEAGSSSYSEFISSFLHFLCDSSGFCMRNERVILS